MSSIHSYNKGDEYDIVNLLELSFDEWKEHADPLNYWNWKWIDSPNGFNIIYTKLDEKIVAVTHIMYIKLKVGNSILKTSYSDDLATHPDYRGRGLYKDLRDLIDNEEPKKGSKIIYSVNAHPATIYSNLKRGRSVLPHKIEHMVLVKNPYLHFKKLNLKYNIIYSIGFYFLKYMNSLRNLFNGLKYKNNFNQIKKISDFDERYDVFWEEIKDDFIFINLKNSEFLNWRYGDKRGGNFQIYEVSKNDQVLGFMVLEIRDKGGYKTGYILELLSLKNREDVIVSLLKNLKDINLNINIINLKTTSKKLMKLLEKFGFIKMPFTKEFQAMYKFIDSDKEKQILLTAKPDEINWGYGDYFP